MKKLHRVFTIIIFLFLYIPMILLCIGSFSSGTDLAHIHGLTLHQYSEFFADGTLIRLLLNSLIVAVISSLVATVIGTFAAVGIHSMKPKLRSLVMTATNIPMTNPDIVTGVSLALLFAFVGRLLHTNQVLGFATLLLAHITYNLPYVILSVMPKLSQMDPNLREAALDLGCTPAQAFFKVVLHEIMPGVLSGALMAFTMSLDDFVISYFVYGPDFVTLPIEIYNFTKKPLPGKIYALFTVLFVFILVVMIIMNLVQAKDEKNSARRQSLKRRKELN